MDSLEAPINSVADRSLFDPMWQAPPAARDDQRNIRLGLTLPTKYYADQPFLVRTDDGGLLCVVTTGLGHEGSRGQHVLAMKTFDLGRTWQNSVAIEDPDGPESSWGIPFKHPSGRIFVFYVFNADDVREIPADNPPYPGGMTRRMDSHGYYVFRWSDDHGKTWSRERGRIPVREFEIDRRNPTLGKIRLFWNVGKPFSTNGALHVPIHKVGGFGEGWFTSSEGGLLCSPDFFTVANPLDASWETFPDGDRGIRAPAGWGPVAEEHSFVVLNDGSFFTVFRTIDGHPACAYSRDGGRTWEPSEPMRYADGHLIKHPRAANFVWRMSDGGYLYIFHNHGGKFLRDHPDRRTLAYHGRNPMWFCRGWEEKTHSGRVLRWGQPEIGIYDDDPMVRISYPDFLEMDGQMLFSETQKATARLHVLDPQVVRSLAADAEIRISGLKEVEIISEWSEAAEDTSRAISWPETLPQFVTRDLEPPYGGTRSREGFAIRLTLQINLDGESPVIASHSGNDGSHFRLEWTIESTLRVWLSDGQTDVVAESDPDTSEAETLHLAINVDGGSNTVCFYRNAILDDGGDERQYGWSRFSPHFRNEYADGPLEFPPMGFARITSFVVYGRTLTSAEIEHLDG